MGHYGLAITLLGVVGRCPAWSQNRDSQGHRPLPARRHDVLHSSGSGTPPAAPPNSSPRTRHVLSKFPRPCGLETARGTCEAAIAAKQRCAICGMGARAPLGPRIPLSFPRRREESSGSLPVPGPHRPVMARLRVRAGVQLPHSWRRVHQSEWFHRPPPCTRDRAWTARFLSWGHIRTNLDSE